MSKAEIRKTHKPIMEKRRRARINQSLNEIKTLILEAMHKDPSRHSKLEKADILEMAVKHLQTVQRQQLSISLATDPSVLRKFKRGFNDCVNEIERYGSKVETIEPTLKDRMSSHLQRCINGIERVAQFSFPGLLEATFAPSSSIFIPSRDAPSNVGDPNNNSQAEGTSSFSLPLDTQDIDSKEGLVKPIPFEQSYNKRSGSSAFVAVAPSIIPPGSTAAILEKPQLKVEFPTTTFEIKPALQETEPDFPSGSRGSQPVFEFARSALQDQTPGTSAVYAPDLIIANDFKMFGNIKVIIQNNDANRKMFAPKRTTDPLCIITNQFERYKQAQTKPDSAGFEENLTAEPRRAPREALDGLLNIVTSDYNSCPQVSSTTGKPDVPEPKNSGGSGGVPPDPSNHDHDHSNGSMWRPW